MPQTGLSGGTELARPPRYVSAPIRLRNLSGGFANQFGWLFFGFGLIFFWVFEGHRIIYSAYVYSGGVEEAVGQVTGYGSTNFSINKQQVMYIDFTFHHPLEGEVWATSYSTGDAALQQGGEVPVEFPVNRPQLARIKGYRLAKGTPWVLLVAIFPLVGLGFILSGISRGRKSNYLLTYGMLAEGKLIAKKSTGARINNRPVYKMTFEFKTEANRSCQVVARTHVPHSLEDEALERLVYDPSDPGYAVLLDNLPASPDIDNNGNFAYLEPARNKFVLFSVIIPGISIIGHGWYLLSLLAG